MVINCKRGENHESDYAWDYWNLPTRLNNTMYEIQEKIRVCAYYKWQNTGCPNGKDLEFWLAAENEIMCGPAFIEADEIEEE